jgi:hypothetical protein
MLTGDTPVTRGDAFLNKNRWAKKQPVFAAEVFFLQP